ncbi:hypothetical protein E3T35_06285 [Cryobacterium sp. TMT1-2-2]|uniref:hypothetical protein n=1 Tax=Cryobacterium sp. TMT1-2-2 TaxID=1259233 RepID=UPI001069B9C5|nr:hypothetical protein [Cryobacterium sp. TMT1-2-2]TFD12892.1 hypothetical protein E3T35_06285 [Cryobacterium sp. TMT1-2-2]
MPITPETELRERNWHVSASHGLIDVHPGVAIPRLVRAWGPLSSAASVEPGGATVDEGFRLEIEAAFSQALGHYTLRSFSVVAPEDEEVTGTLLRTVTPLGVMRWILPRTFQLDASALSVPVVDFVAPELKPYRKASNGGSVSIDLTDVGTVYRLAAIVRYPPAKAVAETFCLQARTATNWIARARAAGLT